MIGSPGELAPGDPTAVRERGELPTVVMCGWGYGLITRVSGALKAGTNSALPR